MEESYNLPLVKFTVIYGRRLLDLLKLHKKRCVMN